MELAIIQKRELIRDLKEMPCFKGKHRRIKTLNRQLSNLIKKRNYKQRI